MAPAVTDTVNGRNSTVRATLLNQDERWIISASPSPATLADRQYKSVNLKVVPKD